MSFKNIPQKYQPAYPRPGVQRRQVIVIEEAPPEIPPLPEFIKDLSLLCRHHPLPLPMVFLGESVSSDGTPIAIYGCSHSYCQYREVWGQDTASGYPLKLWCGSNPNAPKRR